MLTCCARAHARSLARSLDLKARGRSRHFRASSPLSSPGQSTPATWRSAAPPVSPFGLLEELLWDDPWTLLLAAFLLALCPRRQVDPVLFHLRQRFPRAEDAAQVKSLHPSKHASLYVYMNFNHKLV